MNISINSACNKNCSFCFADNANNSQFNMTLEDIDFILSKVNSEEEPIKLIGGEPTIHPQFAEIIERLKKVNNPVVLISNFLTKKDEVWDAVNDYIKSDNTIAFMVNVTELNSGQFEAVSTNILKINHDDFSLSYTIDLTKKWDYYHGELEAFYQAIGPKFNTIRTSINFPNPDYNDKGFYIFENYDYIDMIIKFTKWGLEHYIKTHVDCGIFPCMIRDKETRTFLDSWVDRLRYGCSGSATDVFKNKKASLCYPGKDIYTDITKHSNFNEVHNTLMLKKGLKVYNEKSMPDECKTCQYFAVGECKGPCLGFYNK